MVQDRTIYEDAEIFAYNLHRSRRMTKRDFGTYMALYHSMLDALERKYGEEVGTMNIFFLINDEGTFYLRHRDHADEHLEACLTIRDPRGTWVPGYGWMFPAGDGTVNIGVGALSTMRGFKKLNLNKLIEMAPDLAYAYYNLGFLYSEEGLVVASAMSYGEVLKRDPTNPYSIEIHMRMGEASFTVGMYPAGLSEDMITNKWFVWRHPNSGKSFYQLTYKI